MYSGRWDCVCNGKRPMQGTDNGKKRNIAGLLGTAAVLLALCAAPSLAAEKQSVPMRIGQHGEYTRVVFDFPKLTAYYAGMANGDIVLTFDTPADIALSSAKSAHIAGLKKEATDGDTEKIVIDVPEGATYKHYRLMRKIIVDIYAPGAQTDIPPKVAEAAPEKTPEKMPAAPVETAAVAAPEKKPEKVQEPAPAETPAQTAASGLTPEEKQVEKQAPAAASEKPAEKPALDRAGVIIDKMQPETASAPTPETAEATPADEAMPQDEPTKITISTVEPAMMAAFTRFGTLWIVMDSKAAGAIAPDVKGPQAGILGKPKLLKFDGGIAYRYTMPPQHYVSVARKSMTWEVSLTRKKTQMPTNTHLSVTFDEATRKAKLMAEMRGAGKVLEIEDPVAGDTLYVVPALSQDTRIDQARRFPDLQIIPCAIGLAVRPLKDGIRVNRIESFVMITAQDGIMATPGAAAGPSLMNEDDGTGRNASRLFDFPNWRQGGIARLNENRRALEQRIAAAKSTEERSQAMMKLALLYLANNFGPETLGVLRLIEAEDEEMPKNPNFIAVRGAAAALAGQYDTALQDLGSPALQQHPEVGMWIGYAAAATEQWQLANRSFPKDNYYLVEYPQNIAVPFTVYMAESALRLGNTDTAARLLQSLDTLTEGAEPHYAAAVAYLKGEAARQNGDFDLAQRLWAPVARGLDRLYHAKAGLALANLQVQEKKITLKEAIDTVDSLRFAWRGDGLEVQILSNLGQLKVQDRRFLSGLQDMKAAIALSESLNTDPKPIEDDIRRVMYDLFTNDGARGISPLEAVSIYNEFDRYLPEGEDGMTAALNFADHLIRMDLLGRAAALLEEQLAGGVPEERLGDVGAKLAATYLLDARPSEAISALGKTNASAIKAGTMLERGLLKARAQSELNLTDEAIATLSPLASEDAKRLKADVLWRARKWAQAAEAIEALLPKNPAAIDNETARLAVNAAVAWKLAGDAGRLQDIRARYQKAVSATPLGPTFGVVTRDGGDVSLADRDTILKIAGEVDMFKGFLDSYKSAGNGS